MHVPKTKLHRNAWVAIAAGLTLLPAAFAQDAAKLDPEFTPAALSFESRGVATVAGAEHSGVALKSARLNLAQRWNLDSGAFYGAGVGYEWFGIDAPAEVPLPHRLQGYWASLLAGWKPSESWTLLARVQPGEYNDTHAAARDGLALPGTFVARWQIAPGRTVVGGLRYDALARQHLLPILALHWQLNETWQINLGAPRTEIVWAASHDYALFAGAGFENHGFAVNNPSPAATSPAVPGDTRLDFREFRVGGGVRWRFGDRWSARLEAGAAAGRKFDYYRRDLSITLSSVAYGTLALGASF